jgi:hypothetical protein
MSALRAKAERPRTSGESAAAPATGPTAEPDAEQTRTDLSLSA